MNRSSKWFSAVALLVAVSMTAFVFIGSWQAAAAIDQIVRVGQPAPQGDGAWPAPQGPTDIGYAGDPGKALSLPFEEVAIRTELGDAPAWFVPPASPAAPAATWAVVVHGLGGKRENGYRFLKALHEAGMPTLLISYRNDAGAPQSGDGIHTMGLTEWTDLEAAVKHALAGGAKDVVLIGESMGGAIVGQFLRHSALASNVRAVALDAPALSIPALVRDGVEKAGAPFADLIAAGGLWLSSLRLPVDLSQADVTAELAAFPGPLFLSHGAGDSIVPVATSDRLAELRQATTEYIRTEADHIQSYRENPARYEAALRDFLATLK